ncbi:MAG: family 10 glycosylhydrolase, partial [Proteobacteria bacterium]|nr:family 10 glycosylhydrolase [Pseudomonadota bacterium]
GIVSRHMFKTQLFRIVKRLGVAGFLVFLSNTAIAQPKYAIWVEAEGKVQPFRSVEETKQFIEFVNNNNFTDLYCQVYREGRSWFPSKVTDNFPYQRSLANGYDPLRVILDVAHAKGIKVHAWVNMLRVDDKARLISEEGREVALIDNYKHSLLDYREHFYAPGSKLYIDTPGVWLDPSSDKVRKYLSTIVQDIISNYPDVDGIHLDMIRYPFVGYGEHIAFPYNPNAKDKFLEETGFNPPTPGSGCYNCAKKQVWDDWRRKQVTEVVLAIKNVIDKSPRNYVLSAAVVASEERAYRAALQDWKRWLNQGLIDHVVTMNYANSLKTFMSYANSSLKNAVEKDVVVGIGGWLLLNKQNQFLSQIKYAKDISSGGITLFSYGNLMNSKGRNLLNIANIEFPRQYKRVETEVVSDYSELEEFIFNPSSLD